MDTKEWDEQEMQANFSSNPESKKNWGKKKKGGRQGRLLGIIHKLFLVYYYFTKIFRHILQEHS